MDIQKKIRNWLEGSQDYEEGLSLLQETGIKKHKVFGKLIKGESKTRHEKLAYLLSKQLGLKEVPKPGTKAKGQTKKENNSGPAGNEQQNPEGKEVKDNDSRLSLIGADDDIEDYPGEIKEVIIKYSNLYKERSIAHRRLIDLGDSNEGEIVKTRKEIADEIKAKSEEMEELFGIFKNMMRPEIFHRLRDSRIMSRNRSMS